jgi:hypothetical protein
MKKLIFLLALVAFTLSVNAQRKSSTTSVGATGLKNLVMLPVDSINQIETAYWVFDVNRQRPYHYAVSIAIDTCVHTNNRLAVTVWGSLDNVNWVSSGITQVNVYKTDGSAATDTTLVMSSVTVSGSYPQMWRYLKVRFVSTDTNVKGARITGLGVKAVDVR